MVNKFNINQMVGAKMIEGNDKVRAEKCLAEIKVVLDKDNTKILPQFSISGNEIQSGWVVSVKPRVIELQTLPNIASIASDKIQTEKTLAKINTILDRYDCLIQPRYLMTGINVKTGYAVYAKPREMPLVGGN